MTDALPDLSIDRPQRRLVTPGGMYGCFLAMVVFIGGPWFLFWYAVPMLMPPAGLWREIAPVVIGLLFTMLADPGPAEFTPSNAYRLVATCPVWQRKSEQWWRVLIACGFVPAVIGLMVWRGQELAAGAADHSAMVDALGGLAACITAIAVVMLFNHHGVFLHQAGVQVGDTFYRWEHITGFRCAEDTVVIDVEGASTSHPPVWLRLPRDARDVVFAAAREHGKPVDDGVPTMFPGKFFGLVMVAGCTAAACWASRAGYAWPITASALIAACLVGKVTDDAITGATKPINNPIKNLNLSGKKLDQAGFVARWKETLRKQQPGVVIEEIDPLTLRARVPPSEDWAEHRLQNAWGHYQANPDDLERILAQFTGSAIDAGAMGTVATGRLIATVRHRDAVSEIPADKPDQIPVHRPLAGELVVVLAEDHPRSVRYVNAGDLKDMGIDEATAWKHAAANLPVLVPDRQFASLPGGFAINVPSHAGAVLLDSSYLTQLRFPVQGDWLIALPQRDIAVISGTGEEHARRMLAAAIKGAFGGPGSLTKEVFLVTKDGQWSLDPGPA